MALDLQTVEKAVQTFIREGLEGLPSEETKAFLSLLSDSPAYNMVLLKFLATFENAARSRNLIHQLTLIARMVQLGYLIHSLAMVEGLDHPTTKGPGGVM